MVPLEMRYNADWNEWIPEVFESCGHDVVRVSGPDIDPELKDHGFEDPESLRWLFTQFAELFGDEIIDEVDVVFVPDGELPGSEMIEYYRRLNDTDVEIASVWHCGSYTDAHVTGQNCRRIGSLMETVWFDMADTVFLGSEFHKQQILERRIADEDTFEVTGVPINVREPFSYRRPASERENLIVFPSRLTYDKGYDRVQELEKDGYEIVLSQEEKFSKEEYYELLGRAEYVYAPARNETLGVSVIEGIAAGAKPVVPDELVYPEYVPERFRGLTFCEEEKLPSFDLVERFAYENVLTEWASLL